MHDFPHPTSGSITTASNNAHPLMHATGGVLAAAPIAASEIDQELFGYEALLEELQGELEMMYGKLQPVLAAGADAKPQDSSLPRNSIVARRLNEYNGRMLRILQGFRSIRLDVQL